MRKFRIRTYKLIHAKEVFYVSLIVIILTILFVWILGLGRHHTFFHNSILSITILSIAFFVFIALGLYRGYKLRHVEERSAEPIPFRLPELAAEYLPNGISTPEISDSDGCAEALLSLMLWAFAGIIFAALFWFFGNMIIIGIPLFMGMLYWIFFRAIRLVFKNSRQCKGNLLESIKIGLTYTVLYNFWIYGIFLIIHFFER